VVLAIISGVIRSAAGGASLDGWAIALIVAKAFGFLVGAVVVGSLASPYLFRRALALRATGVVLALSLGLCFGLAWLAAEAGLAPIVGAFAAGLVL
jgi:Kef-type K+ transport system membrane component KefB